MNLQRVKLRKGFVCVLASAFFMNASIVSPVNAYSEADTSSHSLPTASPSDVVYNGSFSQRIEFKVPSQRGIEPRVGLSYDSSRVNSYGSGSLVGAGWRLTGLSMIQRANFRRAVPRFDSNDIWTLDGQELQLCGSYTGAGCGANATHVTRVENYQRIKQISGNNTWEVTARNGTKFVYKPLGTWAQSGTVPLTGDPQTHMLNQYRYLLAEKIDTLGQKVTYSYACGNNLDCRISQISYGIGLIRFHWESRNDTVTYAAGHMLGKSATRLRSVEVRSDGQMLRTYELKYAYSAGTGRSLLTSVLERGRDSSIGAGGVVSGGKPLPAYEFSYTGAAAAPLRVADGRSYEEENPPQELRARAFATLNDDRYVDSLTLTGTVKRVWNAGEYEDHHYCTLKRSDTGTISEWRLDYKQGAPCYIRNGKFHFIKSGHGLGRGYIFNYEREQCHSHSDGHTCNWIPITNNAYGTPDVIGDFNGDGLDDVVDLENDNVAKVVMSDGGSSWGNIRGRGFAAIDMNGDGLADSYHRDQSNVEVRYSNGVSGFSGATFSQAISPMAHDYIGIGDFNGDGVRDFIRALNNGGSFRIAYTVGNTFVEGPDVTLAGSCVSGQTCSSPYAADVNGDGRDDLIVPGWFDKDRGPQKKHGRVFINKGSTFQLISRSGGGGETFDGAIGGTSDTDADGITEFALDTDHEKPGYGAQRWTLVTEKPDLMKEAKAPLGATTKVTYEYHEPVLETDLPLSLFVVKSLETYDGRDVRATTKYTYQNARYDWEERQFLGFEKITAELPKNAGESASPKIETLYMQDVASIGKIKQVERKDGANNVLQKRVETYTVQANTRPFTSLNTRTDATTYYGSVARTKRVERRFNAFGLVDRTTQQGDLSKTGDEWVHTRWPYPNKTDYIVDRWAVEAINSGTAYDYTNGRQWRQWHYYDGANSNVQALPVRGLITQTSEWTGGAAEDKVAQVVNTYDTSNGNLLSESDALGNTTVYVYDTEHKLFPEEIRNPLYPSDNRQKKRLTWDKVCGVVLTATDENGSVTTNTYDNLCRKTETSLPGGGRIKYEYYNWGSPTNSYNRTLTLHPNGNNDIIQDIYFDGFGRTYLEETSR